MALRPRLVRALGAYLTTHTSGLRVLPAAVSPPEAEALLAEVAKPLQRMRYAPAHFDNAIAGYRELRRREWSDANSSVLQRLQRAAEELAGTSVVFSPEVHVLDLAPEGAILPHVDSARFVGPVIAGLSLLSPAVMRFERHDDPNDVFEALLPELSLYVMSGDVRFEYKHAVVDKAFEWDGAQYTRGRRVSMIMRVDTPLTRAPE